jgi:hypothetical protein
MPPASVKTTIACSCDIQLYPEGSDLDCGIHHETARLACAIVDGDKRDGWLSELPQGDSLAAGLDKVLRIGKY